MYSVKVIGNFTLHKHESLITFMALVFSPIVMILLWTTSECQYIHPTNNGKWDSIQPLLVLQLFHTLWQNSQKNHLAFWILEWNKIVIKQEIGPIGLFCYITKCFGINISFCHIVPFEVSDVMVRVRNVSTHIRNLFSWSWSLNWGTTCKEIFCLFTLHF